MSETDMRSSGSISQHFANVHQNSTVNPSSSLLSGVRGRWPLTILDLTSFTPTPAHKNSPNNI